MFEELLKKYESEMTNAFQTGDPVCLQAVLDAILMDAIPKLDLEQPWKEMNDNQKNQLRKETGLDANVHFSTMEQISGLHSILDSGLTFTPEQNNTNTS